MHKATAVVENHHAVSRLRRFHCRATTTRYHHAFFEISIDVHQTPLVLPILAQRRRVVCNLPRFIERFEPVKRLARVVSAEDLRQLVAKWKNRLTKNSRFHS